MFFKVVNETNENDNDSRSIACVYGWRNSFNLESVSAHDTSTSLNLFKFEAQKEFFIIFFFFKYSNIYDFATIRTSVSSASYAFPEISIKYYKFQRITKKEM